MLLPIERRRDFTFREKSVIDSRENQCSGGAAMQWQTGEAAAMRDARISERSERQLRIWNKMGISEKNQHNVITSSQP